MAKALLMPKATAVWLVDNTSLTFEQIAQFCNLHVLEVKGIADGDVAQGIRGHDPITSGQLTREEIEKGQQDTSYRMKMAESKVELPEVKTRRGPKYTPLSRRQDRPNAILWLIRSHPELKDSQIIRLVGTTKPTIHAIRERTHWNSPNLQPQDPVTLGLCSQIDLDNEVQRAAKRLAKEGGDAPLPQEPAETLMPAEATIMSGDHGEAPAAEVEHTQESVFADSGREAEPAPPAEPEPTQESVFAEKESTAQQDKPDEKASEEDEDAEADSVFAKLAQLKEGN